MLQLSDAVIWRRILWGIIFDLIWRLRFNESKIKSFYINGILENFLNFSCFSNLPYICFKIVKYFFKQDNLHIVYFWTLGKWTQYGKLYVCIISYSTRNAIKKKKFTIIFYSIVYHSISLIPKG